MASSVRTEYDISANYIYTHAKCPVGLFSAYLVYNYLLDTDDITEIIPISNHNDFPLPIGKIHNIYFVDLCPSVEFIDKIMNANTFVTIIDHHITNLDKIKTIQTKYPQIECYFDEKNEKCATAIVNSLISNTYDGFDEYVQAIDECDRWCHSSQKSECISRGLYKVHGVLSNKMSSADIIKKFNEMKITLKQNSPEHYASIGLSEKEFDNRIINQLCKEADECKIRLPDGTIYNTALVETRLYRSEVGNKLAESLQVDFSICWSYIIQEDNYWLSFRGKKDGVNVSDICKQLGGGGHAAAAGCTVKNFREMLIF